MKKWFFIIIMVCVQLVGAAQGDCQLLRDAAELCTAGSHEASALATLRQGSDRFKLQELATMATMLENRELDVQMQQSIAATTALVKYAEQHFGKESAEAVATRRQLINSYALIDYTKAYELAMKNVRCAAVMSAKHAKDKQCQLLYLTVQLELIMIEKQRDEDNPHHWEKLYQIEKELEPYLKGKIAYSTELVDACQYMANLQTYQTSYLMYVSSVQNQYFPDGHYLEGRIYNNDIFSNMEAFIQHALDGAKKLWGVNDMRTLNIEIDKLTIQMRNMLADFNTVHDRLSEIQSYMRDYLPKGDFNIDRVELLIWECDIRYNEKLYEIRSAYPILTRVKAYYDEESETYLNTLSQLATLMMMVDISKGDPLLRETETLAKKLCQPGTDWYDLYMSYLITSKQSLAKDRPQELRNYLAECCDYYLQNHRPSWESVYTGRSIANIFSSSLLLNNKAAELQQTVMRDLELLVSKESVIYASCLLELAYYMGGSEDKPTRQKALGYYQKVIDTYNNQDASQGQAYRSLSDLQLSMGMNDEAMQTLRTGIRKCVKPEDGMWRCLMQLLLGWELHSILGLSLDGESRQLFEEAIPFFNAHIEEASGVYMEGYLLIANYYQTNDQFDKAEEILQLGMAHHEALYGEYDYTYSQMLTGLYDLYAQGMNDMDKAEQVLEGRLEAIRQQPSFSLNYVVLQLLWNRYYLLSSKSNDWMLRFTAFNEISQHIMFMGTLAGEDEAIKLRSIAMPLLYECGNLLPTFGNYMRKAERMMENSAGRITQQQVETAQRMSDTFVDLCKNQMLPEFQRVEQELKQGDISYLDNWETLNVYIATAYYYIGIEHDTLKAESYFNELLNSNTSGIRYRAISELANLKVGQGKFEEAVTLYEQQLRLAAQNPLAMASIQDKANYYSALSYAYMMCGRYRDAVAPAKELFRLRQMLANQNFDLMTQNERERFIQDGSIGGDGIITLLPKFPQELSTDCYNVLLASKGLLLRSSERIKKAILQSRDPALLSLTDSLNRLTTRYKTMNTQTDWVHGNYNYNPDAVQIRQQIEALERTINRQAAQFIDGMNTPDWKSLQRVLRPGEVAIEYVLSDSVSCGALILLPQGEPQYVELTPSHKLWKELDQLSSLDASCKAEALYQEDRLKLYDRLWKPMEQKLQGVKTVFYSPTGFLNDLAFAAIKCADDRYLSDHYELHQMLSTGDLLSLREKPDKMPMKAASLYGAVFYSPEHERLAGSISQGVAHRGLAHDGRGAIMDEDEVFGYLSFTEQEIDNVNQILNKYQIATNVLSGFKPTEESLHDLSTNSPQILHLSTHGFFVKNTPQIIDNKFLARFPSTRFSSMQRSGLAFVDANNTWNGATDKPEEADGILTANEVALLDLSKTRLAVLSACRTAVGEYSLEGVYGMHRGFKQAGVKSILATLWNVNDKSTARLMELFYGQWLSGTPMQQSLNEAIRELRKEYPSPFYWAPFVLMDAED